MWLVYMLLWVVSFLAAEGVAFLTHKYVMHGFLWRWHRSHHSVRRYLLEFNDFFACVFLVPSVGCLLLGYFYGLTLLSFVGYGVMSYGVFYFLFHDVLIHQRIHCAYLPRNSYLRRMIYAHHAHHRRHARGGCAPFGFFIVPRHFSKKVASKSHNSLTQCF